MLCQRISKFIQVCLNFHDLIKEVLLDSIGLQYLIVIPEIWIKGRFYTCPVEGIMEMYYRAELFWSIHVAQSGFFHRTEPKTVIPHLSYCIIQASTKFWNPKKGNNYSVSSVLMQWLPYAAINRWLLWVAKSTIDTSKTMVSHVLKTSWIMMSVFMRFIEVSSDNPASGFPFGFYTCCFSCCAVHLTMVAYGVCKVKQNNLHLKFMEQVA